MFTVCHQKIFSANFLFFTRAPTFFGKHPVFHIEWMPLAVSALYCICMIALCAQIRIKELEENVEGEREARLRVSNTIVSLLRLLIYLLACK